MPNIEEYKCPHCGGRVEFDAKTQKLKCPFCDSEFDIDEFNNQEEISEEELNIKEDLTWHAVSDNKWNEEDHLLYYRCNACGGEIVTDETTVATSCPFCDNPVVLVDKLDGDLRPDVVIPFKVDKKDAKKALQDFYKGKKLLPKIFSKESHIEEIKSVYVPFWLFDAEVEADAHFTAYKYRRWREGEYNVIETSTYDVYRGGNMSYDNIPVDGSTKFDDQMMESIEPFDMKEAVDFKTAYLSGYLADCYDVGVDESIKRANERLRNSVIDTLRSNVYGYSTVNYLHSNIYLTEGHSHYALCPVWFLTTSWRGKKYQFAMNGQTGKFIGDLPMDWGQFFKYFIMYSLIAFCVLFAICMIVLLFMMVS